MMRWQGIIAVFASAASAQNQHAGEPQYEFLGQAGQLLLDCAAEEQWVVFRDRVKAASLNRFRDMDIELYQMAESLVPEISDNLMVQGISEFYEDMCEPQLPFFCLYGVVAALFIQARFLLVQQDEDTRHQGRDYLRVARSMLGMQGCMDFFESTGWGMRSLDIESNLIEGVSGFHAWEDLRDGNQPPPATMPRLFNPVSRVEGLGAGESIHGHFNIGVLGTHAALSMEPVTMLTRFLPKASFRAKYHGIAYKCALFDACEDDQSDNSLTMLIGPFDQKSDDSFTLAAIEASLTRILSTNTFLNTADFYVCTSPFIICSLLLKLMQKPTIGFLGLPLLWKKPSDHFENEAVHAQFWQLLDEFFTSPLVVAAVNNPILGEQIRAQSGHELPVVRVHAQFTVPYAPMRMADVLLISRTKFLWRSMECLLQFYEHDPFQFEIANSNSTLSFEYMSQFGQVVILPWEHALMTFYEFYSMNMPLLMPDESWAYRLVYNTGSNLASSTDDYVDFSPKCTSNSSECAPDQHYAPFYFMKDVRKQMYWLKYCDFYIWPQVVYFTSVSDMVHKLMTIDRAHISAGMKDYNDLTLVNHVAFWRGGLKKLIDANNTKAVTDSIDAVDTPIYV